MKTKKNVKKRGLLLLVFGLFLLLVGVVNAQIGIGTDTPHASALLDIENGTMGLLIPRMDLGSLTAASPITNPKESLLVYNTDSANTANNKANAGYYYWHNSVWTPIKGSSKYSKQETKTGKKWFNGKDIYEIVKEGKSNTDGAQYSAELTFGTTGEGGNFTAGGTISDLAKVINIRVLSKSDTNIVYNSASYNGDGSGVTVNFGGVNTTLPSGFYYVIIQYLKQN